MKKKIVFLSVIIGILLIGTVVAGVISRSKVKAVIAAEDECKCQNKNGFSEGVWEPVNINDTPAFKHGELMRCENSGCGKWYYDNVEDHNWSGDAFPAAETGYHNVQCSKCSTTNINVPCEYTENYTEYDAEQHIIYCICGQFTLKNHTFVSGVCECGATESAYVTTDNKCSNCGNGVNYENISTGYHKVVCGFCQVTLIDEETCTKGDNSEISSIANEIHHSVACQYCDGTFPEEHYDEIVDGVCDACGDILCAHPNRVGSYFANNWHNWDCDDCGKNGQEACVDSNEDGKCEICWHCNHTSWIPATCTTPETCKGCGETQGTTIQHDFGYRENTGDNANHTKYCKECVYAELENHYDYNADNLCDACNHLMTSGTTHTHRGGTHENGGKCTDTTCGEIYQAHTKSTTVKNYNKTATTHTPVYECTYVYPTGEKCTGTYNGETQSHYISGGEGTDNNDGTHTGNCKVCSEPYTEEHRDEDDNKKCDICEATIESGTTPDCLHEGGTHENGGKCTKPECGEIYQIHERISTVVKYSDKTDTTHTPEYGCAFNGCTGTYKGEPEAHTDTNNDKKCDKCGYQFSGGIEKPVDCEHTNNTAWGRTETEHWKVCVDCGKEIPGTRTAHKYTNGKCECGRLQNADTCKHTNQVWGRTETEHWKVCVDCGKEIPGTRTAHKYTNGKCECGKLQNADTCKHTNITWGRTETKHWKVCVECGEKIAETEENHSYTNGKCECGRLEDGKTCEHKNTEWKLNKDEHWKVCKDCGEEIEGTREKHELTNEKCKDCGADKDSSTTGKDIPNTGSETVVIGIIAITAVMGMSIIGIKKYKGI